MVTFMSDADRARQRPLPAGSAARREVRDGVTYAILVAGMRFLLAAASGNP
jgi:hypothetical protein